MDWDTAMAGLETADKSKLTRGTMNIRDLLQALGNPERTLRFIHIAGTNGKGSAAAMTASVLRACGFRTGLYISPHIRDFNERMSVNGENITDEALSALRERLLSLLPSLPGMPHAFDLITAMALLWFSEKQCDLVVLEVGLGGRLDSTNVIPAPLCAVMMGIGLEHTALLGDTIEKIACEKAGIIKPGSDVVVLHQSDSAEQVFRSVFNEVNHGLSEPALVFSRPDRLLVQESTLDGHRFSYRTSADEFRDLFLPLAGSYQLENAAVVLEIVQCLRNRGLLLPDQAVKQGLAAVCWPGRFEILKKDPLVIVDGAHNAHGAAALVRSLEALLPGKSFCFIMGVMADKDFDTMIRYTAPLAGRFIAECPAAYERSLSSSQLKERIQKHFSGPVSTEEDVSSALREALKEPDLPIVVFGSLYQIADLKNSLSV